MAKFISDEDAKRVRDQGGSPLMTRFWAAICAFLNVAHEGVKHTFGAFIFGMNDEDGAEDPLYFISYVCYDNAMTPTLLRVLGQEGLTALDGASGTFPTGTVVYLLRETEGARTVVKEIDIGDAVYPTDKTILEEEIVGYTPSETSGKWAVAVKVPAGSLVPVRIEFECC
jgi:hypothetical protein